MNDRADSLLCEAAHSKRLRAISGQAAVACRYFTSRFPGLLLTTYAFAMSHCSEEPLLQQYFPPGAKDFPFASTAVATRLAQNGAVAAGPPLLQAGFQPSNLSILTGHSLLL